MNGNNQDNKPSLSKYFGEAGDNKTSPTAVVFFDEISKSDAPITPLTNTLANIGVLDKDGSDKAVEPIVCKLFVDRNTGITSASFTTSETNKNLTTSAYINLFDTPKTMTTNLNSLPDPSTFFDNIGPSPVMNVPGNNRNVMEGFGSSLDLSLDKVSPTNQPGSGEADRRRDAWIPTDEAKKVLVQAQTSPAGSFFPERDVLTMPGVVLEEDLGDVLYGVVSHYLGESEAVQRSPLDHVAQDERGLRELIQAGAFRAAVNLTTRLLTIYGQGVGRTGHPGKHSPRSLQLWFTRLALLIKIHSFSLCELEAEPFGLLENPDVFFQFYPDMYPNRSGSMASFSFRLLLAEIPLYTGKTDVAIGRLYKVLAVVRKIMNNLKNDLCEVGSDVEISAQDRQESIKLWQGREARVLFSIINCFLQKKDYVVAIDLVEKMASNPMWGGVQSRALYSALGRCCLQAGHILGAEQHFRKATQIRATLFPEQDVRELVDQALLAVAQNAFGEAYQCLVKANEMEPTNIMVLNNMAVCLLYSGKLKDAIAILENAVNSNPSKGLNESLLLNLCTLYELESSDTMSKKLALLRQLCRYKSDTVTNVHVCLKLHTAD